MKEILDSVTEKDLRGFVMSSNKEIVWDWYYAKKLFDKLKFINYWFNSNLEIL